MNNNLIKILIGILFLCLSTSCGSIAVKFGLKENRPFQERKFDAEAWRAGDAQTRGEMAKDLRAKLFEPNNYLLNRKSRKQILELLGEPDRKTRGRCCGAGGTSEEEVWLYNLEVMEDSNMKTEHFQIYFHPTDVVDEWRVEEWDDNKPDYFPRVG